MIEKLRELLRSKAGIGLAAAVVLVGIIAAYMSLRGVMTSEAAALSADRVFIDAKTGKPYELELKEGMPMPAPAPSGGNTGYPAEKCYWTRDGKTKKDPTFVLLNIYKGSKEATFCPDCGRLVVGHNPPPAEGRSAPPTEDEYKKSHGPGNRR